MTTTVDGQVRSVRGLRIVLSILQALLALIFLGHGLMMLFPPAELVAMMNEQMGVPLRLFIGVAEVAAVAGLLGPSLTGWLPWGTKLTAICLCVLMALAMGLHVIRAEYSSALICLVILAMAAFVAYARTKLLPIVPRHLR